MNFPSSKKMRFYQCRLISLLFVLRGVLIVIQNNLLWFYITWVIFRLSVKSSDKNNWKLYTKHGKIINFRSFYVKSDPCHSERRRIKEEKTKQTTSARAKLTWLMRSNQEKPQENITEIDWWYFYSLTTILIFTSSLSTLFRCKIPSHHTHTYTRATAWHFKLKHYHLQQQQQQLEYIWSVTLPSSLLVTRFQEK